MKIVSRYARRVRLKFRKDFLPLRKKRTKLVSKQRTTAPAVASLSHVSALEPMQSADEIAPSPDFIAKKRRQEAPKIESSLLTETAAQLSYETPVNPEFHPREQQMDGAGACIKTVALEKHFGSLKVVQDFSLHVEKGEIYGLLGPNGAGKTTLIKMLCGLLVAASGAAYLFGKRIPDKSVASRIGYMPQELALYNNMTVHENMQFYGEVFSLDRGQIEKRERDLLRLIDLEAYRGTLVSKLSGGMQHRVSLACALLHEPQVLFLDEPTVGVDPELRVTFWEYFEQLRDSGVAILMTTHYMDEARRCNRIGFMHKGRLIAEGSPQKLLELSDTDSLEDAFLEFSRTNKSEEALPLSARQDAST